MSSVSGGSLPNGFVGMTADLIEVRPDDFWRDVRPFAHPVARRGTVWAALLTIAFLALLAALVLAAVAVSFVLPARWSVPVWALVLLAVGALAQQRSAATAKAPLC